jgi:hypothetical protein
MVSMDTREKTKADLSIEDGDHERYAHYVTKEDAMLAYVEGKQIVALCGKIWVPFKDPERFPICPECKRILDALFLSD